MARAAESLPTAARVAAGETERGAGPQGAPSETRSRSAAVAGLRAATAPSGRGTICKQTSARKRDKGAAQGISCASCPPDDLLPANRVGTERRNAAAQRNEEAAGVRPPNGRGAMARSAGNPKATIR